MRKVDDAHDAKDQRQAHADQSVERSGQQTVSTGLKKRTNPVKPPRFAAIRISQSAFRALRLPYFALIASTIRAQE